MEFEVFNDLEMMHKHYRRSHYVCKKNTCYDLAFTDDAQLASHYLNVHGEQVTLTLDFKNSDDEEEEKGDDHYQRIQYNRQIQKRTG